MTKKKLGLILSGGGARGIAHLGLLKALQEWEVKPDLLSGTSAGAIIGALYSHGLEIKEIFNVLQKLKPISIRDVSFKGAGLMSMKSNETKLRALLGSIKFSDLKIPLTVTATDLLTAEPIYISTGELVPAVLASAAIPGIFEPVTIRKQQLIDGSCLACFPVEPLLEKNNFLVGMYVNPVNAVSSLKGIAGVVDRSVHISIYEQVKKQKSLLDIYLEPPELTKYGMFEFNKAAEIMEIGYEYAVKNKQKILATRRR